MGYKYKINHNYFNEIDTEYKAYILGLLYADGSIVQPMGNRQMKIVISLQEEDGYILDKFSQDACGGSKHIYHPPAIKNRGWKKRVVVGATSNIMCKSLISYGCNIRKSREGMSFPHLKKEFIKHFIRGFLDGDGSIILQSVKYNYMRKTTGKRKDTHIQQYKLRVAFSSTDKQFLERIAMELSIKNPYISSRMRKQLIYILWIEKKSDVIETLNYLYSESNYFFKRKYQKFEEFNKIIKSQAENTFSEGLETT